MKSLHRLYQILFFFATRVLSTHHLSYGVMVLLEYLLLRHGPNVLTLIVNQCYVEFDYF